jgi:aspartyl aminopeptidase
MENKNIWLTYSAEEKEELHKICELYKSWLDKGKTERECVELAVELAEKAGYHNLEEYLSEERQIQKGEKIYAVCMKKCIVLFRMGAEPISAGMNILGAHIDSPRIDIKQNPLYEKDDFTYLDTHYYGGIKKYQWVTQPLALHGVVV